MALEEIVDSGWFRVGVLWGLKDLGRDVGWGWVTASSLHSKVTMRSVVGILEMNLTEVDAVELLCYQFGFILVFLASNQQLAKTHFNKV